MQHAQTLLEELETSLVDRPSSRRFTILRQLTGLFLERAETNSDETIQLFDELMDRLIERIERQALIELSNNLAPVERPPQNVIGRLSRDDDIEIAGPILARSPAVSDHDLVYVASTKGQDHLYAIAGRERLSEPVTDVLVDRGDSKVAGKVANNMGARFSRWGFTRALERAEEDASVAVAFANRNDLPQDLLEELVGKATEVVRRRLMAASRPETRHRISRVLSAISEQVTRSALPRRSRKEDFARLRDRISHCVESKDVDELLNTLATLADFPVNTITRLVTGAPGESLVALSKACGLSWPDTENIILALRPELASATGGTNALFDTYAAVSPADAQRAIQFIRANTLRSNERIRELVRSGPAPAAASSGSVCSFR